MKCKNNQELSTFLQEKYETSKTGNTNFIIEHIANLLSQKPSLT